MAKKNKSTKNAKTQAITPAVETPEAVAEAGFEEKKKAVMQGYKPGSMLEAIAFNVFEAGEEGISANDLIAAACDYADRKEDPKAVVSARTYIADMQNLKYAPNCRMRLTKLENKNLVLAELLPRAKKEKKAKATKAKAVKISKSIVGDMLVTAGVAVSEAIVTAATSLVREPVAA